MKIVGKSHGNSIVVFYDTFGMDFHGIKFICSLLSNVLKTGSDRPVAFPVRSLPLNRLAIEQVTNLLNRRFSKDRTVE